MDQKHAGQRELLRSLASYSDMEKVPRDSTWMQPGKSGDRMNKTPHFVLFSRTGEQSFDRHTQGGSWHFRLESAAGEHYFAASDIEAGVSRERLELLAVVRGLESLEQPSMVTLVTSSRQISRAVRQGLEYWRVRNWKWERYGEKVPMKNGDLWQRIDRAMEIHDVRCRTYRVDSAHAGGRPAGPKSPLSQRGVNQSQQRPRRRFRPVVSVALWTANSMHSLANSLQRLLPDTPPNPHLSI